MAAPEPAEELPFEPVEEALEPDSEGLLEPEADLAALAHEAAAVPAFGPVVAASLVVEGQASDEVGQARVDSVEEEDRPMCGNDIQFSLSPIPIMTCARKESYRRISHVSSDDLTTVST